MSDSKNKKFVYLPDTELAGADLHLILLMFKGSDPTEQVYYVHIDEIEQQANRLRLCRNTSEEDEKYQQQALQLLAYLASQPLVERPGQGNDKGDFKKINRKVSSLEEYCKKVEDSVENILPAILDWSELREMQAKNHPNWYQNLGKCTSLIFKVYQQQKGLESQVFDFMFCVEKFAIGVTLDDAPCNLDQAYEVCGYVRVPKLPRKNVDPVLF